MLILYSLIISNNTQELTNSWNKLLEWETNPWCPLHPTLSNLFMQFNKTAWNVDKVPTLTFAHQQTAMPAVPPEWDNLWTWSSLPKLNTVISTSPTREPSARRMPTHSTRGQTETLYSLEELMWHTTLNLDKTLKSQQRAQRAGMEVLMTNSLWLAIITMSYRIQLNSTIRETIIWSTQAVIILLVEGFKQQIRTWEHIKREIRHLELLPINTLSHGRFNEQFVII